MHPSVFEAFDDICRRNAAGGDVLEIGATSDPDTLLRLPSLARAASRTGINIGADREGASIDGMPILCINANAMTAFADGSFDTVLTNATLEHDPHFWKTLAEVRRVARPGALVVIGVPGYDAQPSGIGRSLLRVVGRTPLLRDLLRTRREARQAATPTLVVHNYPGDYYRFSAQAMREVLCAGLEGVRTRTIMMPPRIIGWGFRPAGTTRG